MHSFFHNFHVLPLATKAFYLALVVAMVVNAYLAISPRMKSYWRFHFSYTAGIVGIYVLYIALRLADILDKGDYAILVQWLVPLLVFPFIFPALIIRWESIFFKRALETQAKEVDEA